VRYGEFPICSVVRRPTCMTASLSQLRMLYRGLIGRLFDLAPPPEAVSSTPDFSLTALSSSWAATTTTVKIRVFRNELLEVKAALQRCKGDRHSAVRSPLPGRCVPA
jgi:hypothetical protein